MADKANGVSDDTVKRALSDCPRYVREYVAALEAKLEAAERSIAEIREAVRFAPNSAHWSDVLAGHLGDDCLAGMRMVGQWLAEESTKRHAAEQRAREVEADARRYHVMRDKVCGSPMGHFSFVMFPALPANWRQGSIAQHFDAALDALQGTGSGSADNG